MLSPADSLNMTDDNLTTTTTATLTWGSISKSLFLVFQIVICIIGSIAISVSALVICKYRNMRKPVNIYILNWIICHSISVFFEPLLYVLMQFIRDTPTVDELKCFYYSLMTLLRTIGVFFMVVLMFQWFLKDTKCTWCDRGCSVVVLLVWTYGIAGIIYTVPLCLNEYSLIPDFIGAILQLGLVAFAGVCLMVIHCMRKCANPFSSTSSLPVALITSCALWWVLPFLLFFVHELIWDGTGIFAVLDVLAVMMYLYPLMFIYVFYKLDKQFAVRFRMVLKFSSDADEVTSLERNVHFSQNNSNVIQA